MSRDFYKIATLVLAMAVVLQQAILGNALSKLEAVITEIEQMAEQQDRQVSFHGIKGGRAQHGPVYPASFYCVYHFASTLIVIPNYALGAACCHANGLLVGLTFAASICLSRDALKPRSSATVSAISAAHSCVKSSNGMKLPGSGAESLCIVSMYALYSPSVPVIPQTKSTTTLERSSSSFTSGSRRLQLYVFGIRLSF